MLLVFGALPRPARTYPAPTQLRHVQAIELAKNSSTVEQAKMKLEFVLRLPSGPKGKEAIELLRNLPFGSVVLVYRTKPKSWEGSFKFVSVDDETAVIQLPHGRRIFRSTFVNPFVNQQRGRDQKCPEETWNTCNDEGGCMDEAKVAKTEDAGEAEDLGTVTKKVNVKPGFQEEQMFAEPRKAELEGLLRNARFSRSNYPTYQQATASLVHSSSMKSRRRKRGCRRSPE